MPNSGHWEFSLFLQLLVENPWDQQGLQHLLQQATKISAFLLEADKRYSLSCQLGVTTTTGDSEGEELQTDLKFIQNQISLTLKNIQKLTDAKRENCQLEGAYFAHKTLPHWRT